MYIYIRIITNYRLSRIKICMFFFRLKYSLFKNVCMCVIFFQTSKQNTPKRKICQNKKKQNNELNKQNVKINLVQSNTLIEQILVHSFNMILSDTCPLCNQQVTHRTPIKLSVKSTISNFYFLLFINSSCANSKNVRMAAKTARKKKFSITIHLLWAVFFLSCFFSLVVFRSFSSSHSMCIQRNE